ncbi:hypothetical protein FPOAC2_09620 [Fusarium poae]
MELPHRDIPVSKSRTNVGYGYYRRTRIASDSSHSHQDKKRMNIRRLSATSVSCKPMNPSSDLAAANPFIVLLDIYSIQSPTAAFGLEIQDSDWTRVVRNRHPAVSDARTLEIPDFSILLSVIGKLSRLVIV